MSEPEPDEAPWDEPRWIGESRLLRAALAELRSFPPMCLPGEAEACGGSGEQHYATFLALLLTRVQLYWHNLDSEQQVIAASVYCQEMREVLGPNAELILWPDGQ